MAAVGSPVKPAPAPLTGVLSVDVVRATDLMACDRNGKSDPFVVIQPVVCKGTPRSRPASAKTSVRKRDLNPVWTETLVFSFTKVTEILVKVMDWDLIGSDDVCGETTVTLTDHDLQAGLPRRVLLNLEPQGTLQVVFRFSDASCLFGLDLTTICNREQQTVPWIVQKCISCVEANGLQREGVYRVPGVTAKVEGFKKAFIADAAATDIEHTEHNVNVAASLLKLFLRELPEPVLTNALHDAICEAADLPDGPDKHDRFQGLLARLPPSHLHTAKAIVHHLARVLEFESVNRMTTQNLALCFSPSLLTPTCTGEDHGESASAHMVAQMTQLRQQSLAVSYLVSHTDVFDYEPAEDVDRVDSFEGFGRRHSASANASLMFEETTQGTEGKLSFQDFRRLAYDLGVFIEPTDHEDFNKIDADRDGWIGWDEFQEWWACSSAVWNLEPERQKSLTQAISYFRYFDADESGSLCSSEFQDLHADLIKCGYEIHEAHDKCFQELDLDQNGTISFNEFVRWMIAQEFV